MKKRIICLTLVLCIVLALLPISVNAEDKLPWEENPDEWQVLTASTTNIQASGNYYLNEDVTLSDAITINTADVTLDLNGHVLRYETTETKRTIYIYSYGKLTLNDSRPTATHTDATMPAGGIITNGKTSSNLSPQQLGGCIQVFGQFVMNGGTIYQCCTRNQGGGVLVDKGAYFTMNGGAIRNCIVRPGDGGGVYSRGTFTMNGGEISECETGNSHGAGVCTSGIFTMNGGTIKNCYGRMGGGVAVLPPNSKSYGESIFYANGGTVINCSSENDKRSGAFISGGSNAYTVIKNNSTNGGATIFYSNLYYGIDNCLGDKLVEFMNGDQVYAWEVVASGSKAVEPADSKVDGKTLTSGWYKEKELTNKFDFTSETITEHTKLYAGFEDKSYTVSFNVRGGTPVASKTVKWDDKVLGSETTSKDGYSFKGWMFGDTAINSRTSYKDLADDDEVMSITLTADYADTQAPTISGVTDGGIYCGAQIVTVSDNEGVESVTVNGVPVTLTDGKFTLNPAEGEQTIVATDAAGNTSAPITVTVYNSHVGGTATCKEQATCERCGQKYGDVDSANHTGTKVWAQTETHHEQKWDCCDAIVVSSEEHEWKDGTCEECEYNCKHSGGTATCKEQATCERCGQKYGDVDSANHTGTKVWAQTETHHEQKWDCCDAIVVSSEEHEWKDGTCEECEYNCKHSGGTATCKEQATCEHCGEKYGEVDSANHTGTKVWAQTETHHEQKWDCCDAIVVSSEEHEWKDGACEECEYNCKHSGGTATCKEKATCEHCGQKYGEVDSANHTGTKVWAQTETHHEQKWDCCDAIVVSSEEHEWKDGACEECEYNCKHSGGTATCKEKATCEHCGQKYGEVDSANHTGTKVWAQTETHHEQKWDCCDAIVVSSEEHEWKDGACEECEYNCKHSGGTATCKEQATCEHCGEKYGEVDSANHTGTKVWAQTETHHEQKWNCCDAIVVSSEEHEWKDGACEECEYICKHSGGTATCIDKAKCEHCDQEHGDIDSDNHTSLIHVPAKEATTEDEGNIEYWYCEGCGKYFGDEDCSSEITLDDTVIEKLPLPPTGDNSHMALWFILLFISAAIIVMRRKKIMM